MTLYISTSKDLKATWFPELQRLKALVLPVSCFLFHGLPYLRLILSFLSAKYMRCTFLVGSHPLKTHLIKLFKHFNMKEDQRYVGSCLFACEYLNSSILWFF